LSRAGIFIPTIPMPLDTGGWKKFLNKRIVMLICRIKCNKSIIERIPVSHCFKKGHQVLMTSKSYELDNLFISSSSP
ncbi:MAG: hypothetical protein IPN68_15735, partial [Bacteroidetes bacterium]|nr:hypothetical protein [Bacteroidota bacterium]